MMISLGAGSASATRGGSSCGSGGGAVVITRPMPAFVVAIAIVNLICSGYSHGGSHGWCGHC